MTRILAAAMMLLIVTGTAQAIECLPSASAVRSQHPGMWPSWRRIDGKKCWIGTQPRQRQGGKRRHMVPRRTGSPTHPLPVLHETNFETVWRDRVTEPLTTWRNDYGREP